MADCLFKITIQLDKPIEREGRLLTFINIPCGKCGRCIERRKMEWCFRMSEEMRTAKTAYFVTLTYAPETVPYNGYGKKTLVPDRKTSLKFKLIEQGRKRITKKWKKKQSDDSLEGFFKRLRINQERSGITIEHLKNKLNHKDKIKYYAAGEYGENNTKRPHYHAIIYNASEINIHKSWNLGGVFCVPANEATIAYVMKYLDKRFDKKQHWGIVPEFNCMSEGIGSNYIEKNKHWHKRNLDILFVTTWRGIKIPMPKYYRDKIFTDEEREQQVIIVTDKLQEIRDEKISEYGREWYNKISKAKEKESERRFKKKIKKRIVD